MPNIGAAKGDNRMFGIEQKRRANRGKVIKHVRLEYRNSAENSKKFYEVFLEEINGDEYVIRGVWGRIGGRTPMTQPKDVAESIVDALAKFQDLVIRQEGRGYKRVDR